MNIVAEVKWYLGDDHAYLKYSETQTSFSIDIVLVPPAHRRQGIGRQLIMRVLRLADDSGKEVHVSARPIGQFSEAALENLMRYYEGFGFELLDRGLTAAHMRRPGRRPSDRDVSAAAGTDRPSR